MLGSRVNTINLEALILGMEGPKYSNEKTFPVWRMAESNETTAQFKLEVKNNAAYASAMSHTSYFSSFFFFLHDH